MPRDRSGKLRKRAWRNRRLGLRLHRHGGEALRERRRLGGNEHALGGDWLRNDGVWPLAARLRVCATVANSRDCGIAPTTTNAASAASPTAPATRAAKPAEPPRSASAASASRPDRGSAARAGALPQGRPRTACSRQRFRVLQRGRRRQGAAEFLARVERLVDGGKTGITGAAALAASRAQGGAYIVGNVEGVPSPSRTGALMTTTSRPSVTAFSLDCPLED